MPRRFDVLIVGGGHAGAQAAIALRQQKFEDSVAIVGDEPELPYERPSLSKDYLAGDKPFERILIRPEGFWAERGVEMVSGRPVVAVDAGARSVTTSDGETIGYGKLVWAAGGAPRQLSCAGGVLRGVHSIRSRSDVDRLRSELPDTRRVVVVGGGYIGLEAAAVLRTMGKEVILLEAMDRVLARVAGETISRFYEAEHRARGVDVRTGAAVDCIEDEGGRAAAVRLSDGTTIPADMVIVGIGIAPSISALEAAGAACSNGVEVDEFCRTSLPDVYAIGDCAAHLNRYAGGRRVRLESVQNANDQATTAARSIVGTATPYDAIPWFWSNQYDLKLQTVGISAGFDSAEIHGDPESRSFSVAYYRQGRVVAFDCVNAVKDYVRGRKLITEAFAEA